MRENQDLTLTCIVSDAKPAAQIQWFRNNVEIKSGNEIFTTLTFANCHQLSFYSNSNQHIVSLLDVSFASFFCRRCIRELYSCFMWITNVAHHFNFGPFFFCQIDRRDDKVIESNKRFTTTSRLQLSPTPEEDYVEYSCQAKHKALQPDMPMKATVQLSVLCKLISVNTQLEKCSSFVILKMNREKGAILPNGYYWSQLWSIGVQEQSVNTSVRK